ncbi:MAG: hypothetical protein QM315_01440 [Bacillota bacterium]|nr:hypothetical protein [Bacillota bacterium]
MICLNSLVKYESVSIPIAAATSETGIEVVSSNSYIDFFIRKIIIFVRKPI